MTSRVTVTAVYNCTLERAFKTPMLCDVALVHTGYGFMPRVTHTTEDENWGKPGFSKKIFMKKNLFHPGGEASLDTVMERSDNKYWKIAVSNFKTPMLGFTRFEGEWKTTELRPGEIGIEYTYTLYSDNLLLYPFNWLFTHTFWRMYMKHVLENIRKMIDDEVPYWYD